MADYSIPEPEITPTNLPVGGSAQVNFNTGADQQSPFANFSQTIRNAASAVSNLKAYEKKFNESHESWTNQFKSLHNLIDVGNFTQKDYERILREENKKAQKDGHILAHENFSTMNEVEKERATILSETYKELMLEKIHRMSNPSEVFSLSYEDAESEVIEEMMGMQLADSQGNPVMMDFKNMTPMELVTFSQNKSVHEFAIKNATHKNKSKRSIEASGKRFQGQASKLIDMMLNMPSIPAGVPIDSRMQYDNVLSQIKEAANAASGSGVENTSELLLQTIEDRITAMANDSDLLGAINPEEKIEQFLEEVKANLSLFQLEGKDVMFAGAGTEYEGKIDSMRRSAHTKLSNRRDDLDNAQMDLEDRVLEYAWLELMRLQDEAAEKEQIFDTSNLAFKSSFMQKVQQYGRSIRFYQFSKVETDIEKWFTHNWNSPFPQNTETQTKSKVESPTDAAPGIDGIKTAGHLEYTVNQIDIASKDDERELHRLVREYLDSGEIDVTKASELSKLINIKAQKAIDIAADRVSDISDWVQYGSHKEVVNRLFSKAAQLPSADQPLMKFDHVPSNIINGLQIAGQNLNKIAVNGGEYRGHTELLTNLDAKEIEKLKVSIGSIAFADYQKILSEGVSFTGDITEENAIERNQKVNHYMAVVHEVMAELQALHYKHSKVFTKSEFQLRTFNLGASNKKENK